MLDLDLSIESVAARGRFAAAAPQTIGGVAVGSAGTAGTYTQGFILSGGDDFDTLSLLTPATPFGKYATTRGGYLTPSGGGPRGSSALGGWDSDPNYTGYLDSNRGNKVSSLSDAISVSGSRLTLNQRPATAPEQAHFGLSVTTLSSMIHTGLAMLGRAPLVMEWQEQRAAVTASHMTGWAIQANPFGIVDDLELDIEANSAAGGAGDGTTIKPNANTWSSGTVTNSAGTTQSPSQATTHVYAIAIDVSGNVTFYMDGTSIRSFTTQQAKALAAPFFLLFTNHIYSGQTLAGSAPYYIDWFRFWRPSTGTHWAPRVGNVTINADCGAAFSVTLDTAATVWGSAPPSEVVGACMVEPNEAGGSSVGSTYTALPPGSTYTSGTRALAGTLSPPGRVNLVRYVDNGGDTCAPQRIALNIGPKIQVSSLNFASGQAVSYDLYAQCDCGVLVSDSSGAKAKTISVTGLGSSGLAYSDTTGLITGTAVSGTYTFAVTVTNSVGQSVTSNISVTVASTTAYTAWAGPGWFDLSDGATITITVGSNIDAVANKRSGNGNLTYGGTAGKLTRVLNVQNGLAIARLVRDISGGSAVPRLAASNTAAISTMFQGNDKPYTVLAVYNPTDANTGFIWSASDTVDSTNAQSIALVRRAATASSVRRGLVNATPNDVSWGSGQASGSWRVVAVKHTGTAVTIWDNSLTKAVDASAQDVNTFNTELAFMLMAAESNGASDPTYNTVQCSGDFGEFVVENTAHTDADIQQAITDLATKWGITLT